MNTTRTTTHPYLATTAYYLIFIILGMTSAASGPSLGTFADHTTSELDRISLIFVFVSLGYLIGSFFGGRTYDRFPGHKLMSISVLVVGTMCIVFPIAHTIELLLTAMFLGGLAMGVLDVGGNTLIMWTHGNKSGPFLNGLHFFFGFGSLIAPIVFAQVFDRTQDILWLYWSFAIVCIPASIWLWFLPEPDHEFNKKEKSSTLQFLPVALMVTLFLLYVGFELGFGNWIYTYAFKLGLETSITAAYLTALFWGAFTIGRLLGIWISSRLTSRVILLMDIIGCAISILLIMIWKESSLILWIATFGLGLSMASIFPTMIMLAGERIQITGTVTGWFLVGSGIGSMFLPWFIGQIFAHTGPQAMTSVLLITLTGFSAVILLFVKLKFTPENEQF